MLTIAGNVVKYLRYWKTALKNRAFRCCFQREGDGESPSANLSAASLERPRESAAGASRYRSAEMCVGIIRVVPRLTSPLSQGRGFYFMDKACPCRALHDKGRWHLRQQMTEGICCGFQSAPKFAAFESPQARWASSPCAQGEPFVRVNLPKIFVKRCFLPGGQRRPPLWSRHISGLFDRLTKIQRGKPVFWGESAIDIF